jgi:hypothetical protein
MREAQILRYRWQAMQSSSIRQGHPRIKQDQATRKECFREEHSQVNETCRLGARILLVRKGQEC